jgi:hypothetical protein
MGECSSFMAGPPGSDPEAEAVPFLCGAHNGSDTSHLGEACLDQAVSGLQACVPLGNLVMAGLQALFELAVRSTEEQSACDGAAHLGIERRKPRRDRRGAFLIHNGALSESRQGAPFMPPCLSAALLQRSKAALSLGLREGDDGGRLSSPIITFVSASLLYLGDLSGRGAGWATDGRGLLAEVDCRRSRPCRSRRFRARLLAVSKAAR